MNTDRKVFQKLFSEEKTELGSQKFDFALTDDIKKAQSDLESILGAMAKGKESAYTAVFFFKSLITKSLNTSSIVVDLSKELPAKSKEIGIEVPTLYVEIQKNAIAKQRELQAMLTLVNKILSQL